MEGQVVIQTGAQAFAFADFIREFAGDDELVLTAQGDSIYAATTLSSETISADGEREEC